MKQIFAILTSMVVLVACEINTETSFNKYFGGTSKTSIDMSAFLSFAAAVDSSDNETADFENEMAKVGDSLTDLFNDVPGVSNAFSSMSDGTFEFSFDFEDLDALNRSNKIAQDNPSQGGIYSGGTLSYSKNILTFTPDLAYLDSLRNTGESEGAAMLGMISINQHFKFAKEIKSIDNPHAKLDLDGKGFFLNYKLSDALKEDFDPGFKVKF